MLGGIQVKTIGDSGHYAEGAEEAQRLQRIGGGVAHHWATGWAHAPGWSEITADRYSGLHVFGGKNVIG